MKLTQVVGAVLLTLLAPATASPNPAPVPEGVARHTCKPTATTYVTTITTTTTPYCPTITSTKSVNCPPLTDCIVPLCIVESTETLPCPAGCCPKKTPTVTVTPSCTTTCRGGCATTTYTVTPTKC